jgi:hypothetical protein
LTPRIRNWRAADAVEPFSSLLAALPADRDGSTIVQRLENWIA